MLTETSVYSHLSEAQEDLWNRFHRSAPQSHPYQTPWYQKSKSFLPRAATYFFEGYDGKGQLSTTAILNVISHRLIGFAQGLIFRGPTCMNIDDLKPFIAFILEEAKRKNLAALTVAPYFTDQQAKEAEQILASLAFQVTLNNSGFVTTSEIDLRLSEEEIFSSFHKTLRSTIRRAQKENLEMKFIRSEVDCQDIVEMSLALAKSKKISAVNAGYITYLADQFYKYPERGMIKGLWLEGKMQAFVILIASGDQMIYEHGAGDKTHLLLWDALLAAKSRGFKRFNLGGLQRPGPHEESVNGVSQFKLRFSGKIVDTTKDFELVLNSSVYRRYRVLKALFSKIHL